MTTHHYTVNVPAHPSIVFAMNNVLEKMPPSIVDFSMWATGTGRVALSLVVNESSADAFVMMGIDSQVSEIGRMAVRVGGTFTALSAGPPLQAV